MGIVNPIETPRGYKNPDKGIALRGPLSQFFSGLYLKPLDDAFHEMDVAYFRYQDDILTSMVYVVGENSSTLVIPGLAFMVFGLTQG